MGNVHQGGFIRTAYTNSRNNSIANNNSTSKLTANTLPVTTLGSQMLTENVSETNISSLTNKHSTTHRIVPTKDFTQQKSLMESSIVQHADYKALISERDRLKSEVDELTTVIRRHITECQIWSQTPPFLDTEKYLHTSGLGIPSTPQLSTTYGNKVWPGASPELNDSAAHYKRLGVSGEPTIQQTAPIKLKYYDKDAKSRQEIRNALRNNELLKNLDAIQLQEIVSCMYEYNIDEGCYIIRQDEDGRHLYVAAEGEYEVWSDGKYLYTMGPGSCFGEIALLYNCKRTASIKAVRAARLWVIERNIFKSIMMTTGLQKMQERIKFLTSVPLLKNLEYSKLQRISDVLEAQFHPNDECILRQGEEADSFFIIQSGEVRVTMKVHDEEGIQNEIEIRRMSKGDYFGEKALLGEGRRTANIYSASPDGVELLCLYRKDFLELIGNIETLENKIYVDVTNLGGSGGISTESGLQIDNHRANRSLTNLKADFSPTDMKQTSLDQMLGQREEQKAELELLLQKQYSHEYEVASNLELNDLKIIAVIGQGGFARVDLVHPANDNTTAFALKRMKKVHIVETKQQDHVHSEKQILMSVNSPFICKLFKTFRDRKFVYMLMEFCAGGELWTVLRDRRAFDDKRTLFSLACVINAFEYLHGNGIIYRDLKPENLLLTTNGYIKMCDFGFAKRIGEQRKTWTFCGTPEYVAPEVILNKGHDFAADYWSLGILTCELLMGTPPFQAPEPIKIYMKTLRGIEAYDLGNHKNICAKAYQFIRKLCRNNPAERLGMGYNGIQEIRNQKYFQGFDWEGLRLQRSPSPFHPTVSGPLDNSNFDRFPILDEEPQDEISGWDANF